MDQKQRKVIEAALDAADIMYAEFMDASCSIADQIPIYKAAYAKVKAARKALDNA